MADPTEVLPNVYGLGLFLHDASLTLQGEGIYQDFFNAVCNIALQLWNKAVGYFLPSARLPHSGLLNKMQHKLEKVGQSYQISWKSPTRRWTNRSMFCRAPILSMCHMENTSLKVKESY